MRIFQVLPRRMRFEARHATSVELCVADWVAGSRYRSGTTVFAETGGAPLLDVSIERFAPARRLASYRTAWDLRQAVARRGCDLIVFQQHIATAARIAALNPSLPIVLQTHNFVAPSATGPAAAALDALTAWRLNRLGGITFVSETTRRDFETRWPQVRVPRTVVSNGFDFSGWTPKVPRAKQVLFVGRAQEDKGALEAAEGVARFAARYPAWGAVFVVSEPERNPTYFDAVKAALAPMGPRAELLTGVPFSRIKALNESVAISLVPSKWIEPFGRTAVEAHAGAATLVSSGTGGLREISGDCALYLEAVTPEAIETALARLAQDPSLAEELAREGAARARHLWRLTAPGVPASERDATICERLDAFYDEVVRSWRPA